MITRYSRNGCTYKSPYGRITSLLSETHRELPYKLLLRPLEDMHVDTDENLERMENPRTNNERQTIHINCKYFNHQLPHKPICCWCASFIRKFLTLYPPLIMGLLSGHQSFFLSLFQQPLSGLLPASAPWICSRHPF